VAITWEDLPQEQRQELLGGASWGDWTYEEQAEDALERSTTQTVRRGKPLKINRDLLLVSWSPLTSQLSP
jgi:hypothetical protein